MKLTLPEASLPAPSSPPHAVTSRRSAASSAASVPILLRTGGNLSFSLVAVCVLLAGCGGSDGGADSAPTTVPSCAKPKQTIPRPETLPAKLPIPPGTLFTRVETPFAGQSIVSGVSPGSLGSVRSFFNEKLDEAGYQQGRGESEPGETEALFSGRGERGGWRANAIPRCEGAVRLTLVLVKS
jgi:hypothetical protein